MERNREDAGARILEILSRQVIAVKDTMYYIELLIRDMNDRVGIGVGNKMLGFKFVRSSRSMYRWLNIDIYVMFVRNNIKVSAPNNNALSTFSG